MYSATVTFSSHEVALVQQLTEVANDIRAEIVQSGQSLREPGNLVMLWWAQASRQSDFEVLDDVLASTSEITNSIVLYEEETTRLYRTLHQDRINPGAIAAEFGFLMTDIVFKDEKWTIDVLLPDRESFEEMLGFAKEYGLGANVTRMNEYGDQLPPQSQSVGRALTASQREILETASELGYYEDPRQATLDDIAAVLDISHSAAGRRIRRAHRSLVSIIS